MISIVLSVLFFLAAAIVTLPVGESIAGSPLLWISICACAATLLGLIHAVLRSSLLVTKYGRKLTWRDVVFFVFGYVAFVLIAQAFGR